MSEQTLAFVIPWYGRSILGGAEMECRKTAEHLAAAGMPVEVLTTCARDLYGGWTADHHREGLTEEGGVRVRRFALSREPLVRYGEINERLIARERISTEDELRFLRESVNSERLYRYLDSERDRYRYLFIPYLFGTTYHGAQIAPERSWIIPCLHDEGYARMGVLASLFRTVQGLILHTATERDLARDLYGIDAGRLLLWGEGVDTEESGDADRFRSKYGIDGPFVLYVGRRDRSKNTPLLIEYFCRYLLHQKEKAGGLKLVVAGPGNIEVPGRFRDRVIDIGPIADKDKLDAFSAAFVFVQPSVNESFSLVVMESWVQGTPVLVNADCAATNHHAHSSNGGLPFRGFAEFAGCLDYLLEHPAVGRALGDQGRRYVLANYTWDKIVERYGRLLG